jgi:periplasmic divalent cation tolerance protein
MPNEINYMVILTTCPDEATAERLARTLVEERLAACVNRLAGVRSTYRWQGEVHDEPEVLLVIKTTAATVGTLSARLLDLHPYEVPEVLALPVAGGSERYLQWLGLNVGPAVRTSTPGID